MRITVIKPNSTVSMTDKAAKAAQDAAQDAAPGAQIVGITCHRSPPAIQGPEDAAELDSFYEDEMPGPATQPLFDEAARPGIGTAIFGHEAGGRMGGQSAIVAPSGGITARAVTICNRGITAKSDLDMGRIYKDTVCNFAQHRRPKAYGLITERAGVTLPEQAHVSCHQRRHGRHT